MIQLDYYQGKLERLIKNGIFVLFSTIIMAGERKTPTMYMMIVMLAAITLIIIAIVKLSVELNPQSRK